MVCFSTSPECRCLGHGWHQSCLFAVGHFYMFPLVATARYSGSCAHTFIAVLFLTVLCRSCRVPSLAYRGGNGRHHVDLSSLRATKVSAEEAHARLGSVPSYVKEWPSCKGFCHNGMCALKWDHPACCSVHRAHYDSVDGQEGADAAADTASQDADALSSGHWEGRDWYCWD